MIKWWLLPVEDVSRHLLYCGTGLGCPLFHGLLCLSTLAESNAATSQRAVLLGTDSHHSHCDCFQPFMESHAEYIFTNSTTILSQFHIKEAHTWQHCCLHGENVVSILLQKYVGQCSALVLSDEAQTQIVGERIPSNTAHVVRAVGALVPFKDGSWEKQWMGGGSNLPWNLKVTHQARNLRKPAQESC